MAIFTGHTAIIVSDMERALRFYVDLLGLRVTNDFGGGYNDASFLTRTPGSTMKFALLSADDDLQCVELFEFKGCEQAKPFERSNHVDYFSSHIAFLSDDIDSLYEKLIAAGVEVDIPLTEAGGAKFAYLFDPDGYMVELVDVNSAI
jgi:catechol 2,3-dioxygenase-like lactoylglutathione lyase family enzyme